MKKIIAIFGIFSLLFLSSCATEERCDIYDFADRFSSSNEQFKIETKNLTAEEDDGYIIFPFNFDDKFLLSVKADEKTSFVQSLSVVFLFEKKHNISDKDFSSFLSLSSSAVNALTKYEKAENIFKELSIDKKENLLKQNHTSYTLEFYDYSFVSTEIGIYFSITRSK